MAVGAVATLSAIILVSRCWANTPAAGTAAPDAAALQPSRAEPSARARAGRGAGAELARTFGLKRRGDGQLPEASGHSGRHGRPPPSTESEKVRDDDSASRFVPDFEETAAAEEALDEWGQLANERGEDTHPLRALQGDPRFGGDAGLRLTVTDSPLNLSLSLSLQR